jgi:hypothetical protein
MVFENRVLRKIFGPKKDEVTGEWRKLHNKEVYFFHQNHSGGQIKKNYLDTACGTHGTQEKCI